MRCYVNYETPAWADRREVTAYPLSFESCADRALNHRILLRFVLLTRDELFGNEVARHPLI